MDMMAVGVDSDRKSNVASHANCLCHLFPRFLNACDNIQTHKNGIHVPCTNNRK